MPPSLAMMEHNARWGKRMRKWNNPHYIRMRVTAYKKSKPDTYGALQKHRRETRMNERLELQRQLQQPINARTQREIMKKLGKTWPVSKSRTRRRTIR